MPQHALQEALMTNLNHRSFAPTRMAIPCSVLWCGRKHIADTLDDGEPLADVLYVRTSLIYADGTQKLG